VALGSFDLLSRIGLTKRPGVAVHSLFPADQVLYFQPMTNLAWHQVHHGQVPLWNPYNLLGIPLAFNWQSGVFSLPTLASYLVPLSYSYTVIVLLKLVIAGAGVYTLCRVLGLRPLASAFAATTFELSGPMLHWYGWAMTGVTAWSGWILVAAILLIRGAHRVRDTIFLAVAIALAVYGGHPEAIIVLSVGFVVFFAVFLVMRARTTGAPVRRPLVDLLIAGACGAGLSAPLLLPGLQTAAISGRGAAQGASAYPFGAIPDAFAALQGTDFRVPPPYIGVLAIVLAVAAVRLLWRRPEVVALAAAAVVATLLSFSSPLYGVLDAAPVLRTITWNRSVMVMSLTVAVLAAFGLDALTDRGAPAMLRRWVTGGLVAAAAVLAVAAVTVALGLHQLAGNQAAHFAWPVVGVVVGLTVVGALGARAWPTAVRRWQPVVARYGGPILLVAQTGFLVTAGVSFWSLSDQYFAVTPGVATLQRAVGDAVVGMGPCRLRPFSYPYSVEQGVRPDANIAYGIHEFAAYEPPLTGAYYRSWTYVSGQTVDHKNQRVGVFCPQITSARVARIYGVQYLLTARTDPAPSGAVFERVIDGERLYRVPGAAQATLVRVPPSGTRPPVDAPGTPVAVTQPQPGQWRMVTNATSPALLRLRLTNVPGWHATIDGSPLATEVWGGGAMLETRIPAGHHVVTLHYWPDLFTGGLAVAAVTALALAAVAVVARVRRPSDRLPPTPAPAGPSRSPVRAASS
jgi:hypothetical protein